MKHSKHSHGFSLILSLTVMASIVMLLVTLSAFMTVESRAVLNQQLAVRAKLNSIVSLRLALAHLQQEAGVDRRATARGEITQAAVTADKTTNPMWTGVWRSDKPDAPPAWLVSGRDDLTAGAQSASLIGLTDYPTEVWTPWQADFNPLLWTLEDKARRLVTLVGKGSAGPAEPAEVAKPWTARPSGLVALPKITLPDDTVSGRYAYWIGDEGIKARINLGDAFRKAAAANSAENQLLLRSPGTSGHDLLPGMANVSDTQLTRLETPRGMRLLTSFDLGTKVTPNDRRLFHDVSMTSAGVLSDSANGGLRRDLSTAFELSDAEFGNTEFGNSTKGAATMTENGLQAAPMRIQYEATTLLTPPIFSRNNTNPNGGKVLGPTWWALRDYHRLYKQLGWNAGNPTLVARTTYPNARKMYSENDFVSRQNLLNRIQNDEMQVRAIIPVYSDTFSGDQSTTLNPNATDTYGFTPAPLSIPIPGPPTTSIPTRALPRPTAVAATPYVFSVNIEYYMGGGADLWFNLTPIVVVHNPYNVAITYKDANSSSSSVNRRFAAISFTDWQQWTFRFTRYTVYGTGPKYQFNVPLSNFFSTQSKGLANDKDMFRVYFPPDLTLQPGEFRVLSCPTGGMVSWKQATTLVNGFNQTGGFKDENPDWSTGSPNVLWSGDDTFGFQIVPGGNFRARYGLACWPGDRLIDNEGSAQRTSEFYVDSSEHSEIFYRSMDANRIGAPIEKKFFDYTSIAWRTSGGYSGVGVPLPPNIIGVFDFVAKTADSTKNGFPTFTHSNPMASVLRADAGGRDPVSGNGLNGPSPSYAMKAWLPSGSPTTQWPQVIQTVGGLSFGGYSTNSSGSTRAVLTEIPLVQPMSLAQYAHANLTIRDQQPLLSVGNSFATPLVKSNTVVQDQTDMANWSDYDHTYLINEALWDSFYLSSIAPRMDRDAAANPWTPEPGDLLAATSPSPMSAIAGTPAGPPVHTAQATIIKNFVDGSARLDNPRFILPPGKANDGNTQAALANYKKSASVLLNQGAFNVNSTSVEAWMAFLGSAKKLAIGSNGATSPAATDSARFPRSLQAQTMTPADKTKNLSNASSWTGFGNLSDTQMANLAIAIVAENKARFATSVRTPKTQTPTSRRFRGMADAGAKAATPYLTLSEFVNRFVSDDTWASRCGALQAAIFLADKMTSGTAYATGFSDRLSSLPAAMKLTRNVFDAGTLLDPSFAANPENIELVAQGDMAPRAHTALAAPGNLLQSDLLQSLGSAIATRSDTFTIRCYGEAIQSNGETGAAWIEAVVQRLPDYIDESNAPEATSGLSLINSTLGRRFRIISSRWLKPDEI